MTARRVALLVLAVAAARAQAGDAPATMPGTPAALETTRPPAPMTVRQKDAAAILRRVPVRPETPETAPPPAGTTREYTVEPVPVVNPTSRFVFADETERPAPRVRTFAEREAAVEAVRQSLRRTGAK